MLDEAGLRQRAKLIQAVRCFFAGRGYMEVDTPLRLPVLIPEAHNRAVESDGFFLQTSPESCMKRLLAEAGCSRIFQVCRCFRGKERGDRHLPEFTMLEWYRTACDYLSLMEECEDLLVEVAREVGSGVSLSVQGAAVDLAKPWERLTVADAFSRYAPIPLNRALAQNRFDEVLCTHIEPRLGKKKPVFLYDYPVELGALARSKKENPDLAERFELYIAGLELANGFSELTDAAEQRQRFERERDHLRKQGRPVAAMPEKFLAALPHMPETAGIALGVDRLAMVLFDAASIDRVVSFTPEDL